MPKLSKTQIWTLWGLDATLSTQHLHDGRTLRALKRRGLIAAAYWVGGPARWAIRLSAAGRKLVGELHGLSPATLDQL